MLLTAAARAAGEVDSAIGREINHIYCVINAFDNYASSEPLVQIDQSS
jgi:hypothetical protein